MLHPSTACVAPSGTMKTSPQRIGFQVRSSLGPLDPESDVHSIFSNRELPSTSWKKENAIAIVYKYLVSFWKTLTTLKSTSYTWYCGFYYIVHGPSRKTLSSQMRTFNSISFKLCICVYLQAICIIYKFRLIEYVCL